MEPGPAGPPATAGGSAPAVLLFDLDGTLVDTGGAGCRAIERAFLALFGVEGVMAGIRPDGMMDPEIVAACYCKALQVGSAPPEDMERLLSAYLAFLREEVERSDGYRVLPGVVATLRHLGERGDVLVGLGTGNLREGARIKLERGGLWRFFRFGGFGEDGPDRPAMLLSALRRAEAEAGMHLSPERTTVVGDTPLDVAAARAAGLRCVTVATGRFDREALLGIGPDAHLDDLTDLAGLLWAVGLSPQG